MVPRFDLVDIVQTLQRKLKFILIVTVVAALIGAIFFLAGKRKYKAKSAFFVANSYYNDRNNIIRTDYAQFVEYFAKEDDIDKVIAIAKSDSLKRRVISHMNLAEHYKLNPADPKQMTKLIEIFDGKYDAKRDEYTSMEVSYKDEDAALAAAVANEIVNSISEMYSGFFIGLRTQVQGSLKAKIKQMDSSIVTLTDSLASLRDKYQLYDLISPSRRNLMLGTMKSGGAGFGRAVEEIQNIESVKDQLVVDRTGYISLLNGFESNINDAKLPLVHVVSRASAPYKADGFSLIITVAIAGMLGLFFICVWILLVTYFRAVLNTKR